MANDNTKLQYIIELLTQGDAKKAAAELEALKKSGDGAATAFGGLKAGAVAAFAALGGATAFIKESIDAFLEQERAISKLNAALKSTGQFTPEVSEEMIALSEAMAQASLYADDAILNVIAKLTAAGAKKEDIERLTQAVLDLSTLMDRDLNRATQAFALALQGEVGALKAAGVQLDETTSSTQQFNAALEQIEKKAGGQAKEAIKGLAGEVNQMAKDWDAAKEASGNFFLRLNSQIFQTGRDLKSFFNSMGTRDPNTPVSGPDEVRYPSPLSAASNAALMRGRSGATAVTTPGLSLQDEIAGLEQMAKLDDEIVKLVNEEADARARSQDLIDKQSLEALDSYRASEQMRQDLAMQTVLTQLDGEKRVSAQIEFDHIRRMDQIREMKFETEEQFIETMNAEEQLYLAQQKRFEQAQSYSYKLGQDMKQVGENGAQAFSSGLAGAIVSAFEEGDKAFQKFAANFLRQIAEMILQALILRAIKGAFGMADGGQAQAMANGGVIYAAGGLSGVSELNSATYFPKFNVVAGEAGREVMTVLSRPRFERINGVPAQVGYAQGNRLAIANADALAGAGGGGIGGKISIEVRVSKGAEAEIIENSVQRARVAVVQDMSEDSQLSRVTRKRMA